MPEGPETGLTLVCGADRATSAAVAGSLRGPHGVLVAHDLRGLGEGVVHRRVVDDDPAPNTVRDSVLELAHGCVACTRDAGVGLPHVGHRRPFHPERLHTAIDVLLRGTIRARGRIWVASQPDHVLWLESAGGALQVRFAGTWLAGSQDWGDVDDERRAAASLRWDDRFGDREQQLVVLVHDADPAGIVEALDHALLTDAELACDEAAWRRFPDPFEHRHVDPCAERPGAVDGAFERTEGER